MSNDNEKSLGERLNSIENKVDLIYNLILEGNAAGENASKELTSQLTGIFENITSQVDNGNASHSIDDLPNVSDLNDLLESLKDFSSKIKDVY